MRSSKTCKINSITYHHDDVLDLALFESSSSASHCKYLHICIFAYLLQRLLNKDNSKQRKDLKCLLQVNNDIVHNIPITY